MKNSMWVVLIPIAIMAAIFFFSSQSAEQSSNTSKPVAEIVVEIVRAIRGPEAVDTPEEVNAIHVFVRKAAHFVVYLILGFFLLICLRDMLYRGILISWVVCLMFASSDELHQFYVPGRSMQLTDVEIDMAGATVGIVVAIIILIKRARKNQKTGTL